MSRLAHLAAGLALLAGLPLAAGADQGLEQRIIAVAERVKPSVVHIEAIVRAGDRRRSVTGSGLIASADGRILTNQHVVDRAEKVMVSVPGVKRKLRARVIGTDVQTDIALLRVEADAPLAAAAFGSADLVRVGQWVLAIGNPYGLDGTVSLGIVSAKGRNLEVPNLLNDFIQTDAMIDRGSSGGPLVDLEGRVLGINSRGQGRGIGFTIPIDTALAVMEQLERGGIARGYLGISMQPLDRELADYFGLASTTGVVVNSVIEDSPAARAGLETGDIITHFNGVPIEAEKAEDLGVLQRLVADVGPGQQATLRVIRDGEPRSFRFETGTQPTVDPDEAESESGGFQVQEITTQVARDYRLESDRGALVSFVSPGSPASEAGLRVGDVIERIEEERVDDLKDFRRAMARAETRRRYLLTVRRGEETKFLLLRPGGRRGGEEPGEPADEAAHRDS